MWNRLLKSLGVPDGPATVHAPAPDRGTPSLAREALLAAINPTTGRRWNTNTRYAVAAAILLELAHEGRFTVSGTGKALRYTLRDSTPLGDPVLDEALQSLDAAGFGKELARYVSVMPSDDRLIEQLVGQGLLVDETHRVLGVLPRRRLLPTATAGREEVVARIRSALVGEAVPDERTALLVVALHVGIPCSLFVPRGRVREADRRRDELLESIGDDVRAVVMAVRAVRDRRGGGESSSV
ncbi:GOLPH3/VPS74 family protein [Nocardioides sp. AX2bis]|uniref:GOLPH3/VPS74 family protein n=1 Tax=Nocardioides sp. AX2bis TaxID=2653157 RepID=UPI0012F320FC|nr:GPP34 family phosphoprotein [Nocardioides sp. AX2bis]VXB81121.1 conserved hypothetical protein [Nocardioides sp. AX2bis]